jgi:hypothetical protein
MRQTPKRALSVVLVVALASIGGCGSKSLSEKDVRDVARGEGGKVFYVGTEFAGLPLTHASKFPPESPLSVSFGYGDCEPPGNDGGCPLPLEIQSTVCPDGHTKVGIFGYPQKLREQASRNLRPADGGEAPAPEVVFDTGPICGS